MNTALKNITLLLCFAGALFGDDNRIQIDSKFRPKIYMDESTYVVIRKENVYVADNEGGSYRFKITPENDLYIRGKSVDLSGSQRNLVRSFYDYAYSVSEDSKAIGIEGAKIGISGAGLGLKAGLSVLKLLLPGYDSDDLERDMDEAASKVEEKADVLEEKADNLELIIDDMQDIYESLIESLPELSEDDWI